MVMQTSTITGSLLQSGGVGKLLKQFTCLFKDTLKTAQPSLLKMYLDLLYVSCQGVSEGSCSHL